MLEDNQDRHEQLKLQAQKQHLIEGNSNEALPACCNDHAAADDEEDLDALTY